MFIRKPVVTFFHLNPQQIYRHDGAWHVLIISLRLWLYFFHLNLSVRVKVCVRVYACGRGLPTLISVCPVVCNAPRLVIWVYLDELIGRDRAVDAWVSHRRPCRMNLSNLLWRVCLKSTHRHICWPCLGLWWCTYIQVSGHNIISLLKSFNALWVMPQVSIREHICANLYLVTEGDRTTVAHWGYFST